MLILLLSFNSGYNLHITIRSNLLSLIPLDWLSQEHTLRKRFSWKDLIKSVPRTTDKAEGKWEKKEAKKVYQGKCHSGLISLRPAENSFSEQCLHGSMRELENYTPTAVSKDKELSLGRM